MPAVTKEQLHDITKKEYAKLTKLIGTHDAATAIKKREEDTSIKDVIAHRAHWIDLFLGWHADGLAGIEVHFPAKGYKWNDLKRYNADLRNRQSDLDWSAAVAMLDTRYTRLLQLIDGLSEAELYGGPMQGANNAWTTGRWAEAAGASHFSSAAKYVRACLKSGT